MEGWTPPTLERQAFLDGLFQELDGQLHRYLELVGQLATLQARLDIIEHSLQVTRDHVRDVLRRSVDEVPPNWQQTLARVRFVGVRLGDACVEILRKRESLTAQDILNELNSGQFRFRTGSPLREITAALLRQPRVKRREDRWVYVPEAEVVDRQETAVA
jgi:hypothetical protein